MAVVSIHPELVKKWTQGFHFYNIDGDGFWCKRDFDAVQRNIMSKAQLSDEKKEEAKCIASLMWNSILGQENNAMLSLEQFIQQFGKCLRSGKMAEQAIDYRRRLFYCMDLNQSGKIEWKEFLLFAECLGRASTPNMDRAFKAMDPDKNGKITEKQYVDAYVRYWTDAGTKIDDLPLYGLPGDLQ